MEGLLLTGVYGVGKSTLCAEIADMLEASGQAFGAIDLDWLTWFAGPEIGEHDHRSIGLANLSAVLSNLIEAGINRFVLAGSILTDADLAAMEAALPFPLRVVCLNVPLEEIRVRLSSSMNAARQEDLRQTELWLASGIGRDIGHVTLDNDRRFPWSPKRFWNGSAGDIGAFAIPPRVRNRRTGGAGETVKCCRSSRATSRRDGDGSG